MKSYGSRNTIALNKRVKKAHAKAKFAGVLYLLGALAMVAFVCLPILSIGGTALTITSCFTFLSEGLSARDWAKVGSAVLYLLLFLTCIVNFFKSFKKLGWLSKRSDRYVNGYNRKMQSMERMGKCFSRSFAALVNIYFLIYILNSDKTLDLTMAYLVLAVGLVVHFFAGIVGGKVSYFNVGGPNIDVEEEPRTIGMFVYFFRNLVQVVATAWIIKEFAPICTLNTVLLAGNVGAIELGIQAAIVLFTLVLVKHATGITEFNRFGMEGAGMKNNRIFSFLTAAVAGVAYVMVTQDKDVYLMIAVAAVVSFLVDCIFKSKIKEEDAPVKEKRRSKKEKDVYMQQRNVITQPVINVQQPESKQQPIYVPVYYPLPMSQPAAQQPVVRERYHTVMPYPMPYPMPVAAPYGRPMQQPAPMPRQPFGMPPAPPAPNPATCAMAQKCAAQAQTPATAPVSTPAPAPAAAPSPVCVMMVRPEPSPAPEHLQAKPVEPSEAPKTKKQLRKEKKEEKAQAKFLKKSKKSAKKATKLEKQAKKDEAKEAKKNAKTAAEVEKKANKVAAKTAKKEQKFADTERKLSIREREAALRQLEQQLPTTPSVTAPVQEVQESVPFDNEPQEINVPLDPQKSFNVRCPQCAKHLTVKDVSPYHRCPSCGKVFSLRKFETYVKKS